MKRNDHILNEASERIAGKIAAMIVSYQSMAALKLNAIANRYSRRSQKCALIVFSSIIAIILVIQIQFPSNAFSSSISKARARHIGLPSDLPLKPKPIRRTDSLTLKK